MSTFSPSYHLKDPLFVNSRNRLITNEGIISRDPFPYMYISIFAMWGLALIWFQPRLLSLLDMGYSNTSTFVLILFILFIDLAWLYGFFNLGVIFFGVIYNRFHKKPEDSLARIKLLEYPQVAILYTTYNDFVEASVQSCVNQDYPNFHVYILDDSTDPAYMAKVDGFANGYPDLITVVRRSDRKAFKAGNLNHGLAYYATEEPYFAIADADEILPKDFLTKLVPVIESDEKCGFVQANHICNPAHESSLSKAMGKGIDIHWKYYQPLRNAYGFVMFLGHGALLRRKCWEETSGFPDIVSEDLGFAIDIREKGYRGRFVKDVVCYEDFPDSIRSFRIRHMKWTRGTTEFLHKNFKSLIKSKKITWTEKLDILFPTLNLPLTLVYFLFMLIANLALPYFFGQKQLLTLELGSYSIEFPIIALSAGFEAIYTLDFFLITMLTFFAPVLCFIIAMRHSPISLAKFISQSTSLYAALGPLSSIGVVAYMISGKAIFLVTGNKNQEVQNHTQVANKWREKLVGWWKQFINRSHPDTASVQWIEFSTGLALAIACILMLQVSFFGLCLAFMFMPLMHKLGWDHVLSKWIVHLPFTFIVLGILLAGLSLVGMQTVFFGYGFHF